MELSLRVVKEWTENYTVKSLQFRRGTLIHRDELITVVQSSGKEAKILIPYSAVAIEYVEENELKLALHKRMKEGFVSTDSGSTCAEQQKFGVRIFEIVTAQFQLPKNYKIEGLEEEIRPPYFQ